MPDESENPEDEGLYFVELDEEELLRYELEEEAPDEPEPEVVEDLSVGFDYSHNRHIKCVIHRLETCVRTSFKGNEALNKLRLVCRRMLLV